MKRPSVRQAADAGFVRIGSEPEIRRARGMSLLQSGVTIIYVMCAYQHTQQGTLMLAALGGGAVVAGGTALLLVTTGSPAVIPGLVALTLVICALLFYSLNVTVSAERIILRFGVGLIRRRFAVSDIDNARIVQNRWYYGWGIKYTPHGWLFNVSGFDAVEIQLRSGRKYRIGTDEPQELHAAIHNAMECERSKPFPKC